MLLPLGRRPTSLDRRIAAIYFAGTLSGALVTALLAWALGGFTEPLADSARVALLCIGAVVAWMAKHGPLVDRLKLPEARRQIPTAIFADSLSRGAYLFGCQMGTGMRTYVPAFAPYVLLLAVLVARPTLLEALLVAAGFGLGRALPLLVHLRAEDQELMSQNFLRGTDYRLAHTAAGAVVLAGGLILV